MSIKKSQAKCTVNIGLPVIWCFQHLDRHVELKKVLSVTKHGFVF